MKKKSIAPMLGVLNLAVVVGELVHCRAATLHTGKDPEHEQMSHPGVDFQAFPTLTLTVEKAKGHYLAEDAPRPRLLVHTKALAHQGVFIQINGHVESLVDRDERLAVITFVADRILLKKESNLDTKETWDIAA